MRRDAFITIFIKMNMIEDNFYIIKIQKRNKEAEGWSACLFSHNIQKYCIHDGDGIRTTVFFKGVSSAVRLVS